MSKTITVKLNPQSIADAIDEINAYRKEIETKVKLLVRKMVNDGADIARVKILSFDAIDVGELLASVDAAYSADSMVGYVRVGTDHAAFVEFGTGIIGQSNPHENYEYLSKAAWAYASGRKIFVTQDGRVGWIYPTDDGGYRFTEGMESRPFMYHTALELQRKFPSIVKEVFG